MFICLYNKCNQTMKKKLVSKTVTLPYLSRRKQDFSVSFELFLLHYLYHLEKEDEI